MFFFSYNIMEKFGDKMHEVFSIVILVFASTIDTFVAGFIYGIGKIKIPISSSIIIGLISSIIFTVSIAFGNLIGSYLSSSVIKMICFILLFMLGLIKFFDGILKDMIRRYQNKKRMLKFRVKGFTFVLTIFTNPERADIDKSKILSVSEAFSAALAFSLDGVGIGMIAGMSRLHLGYCFGISFFVTMLMLTVGLWIGKYYSRYLKYDISWLSGLLLMVFAIIKL